MSFIVKNLHHFFLLLVILKTWQCRELFWNFCLHILYCSVAADSWHKPPLFFPFVYLIALPFCVVELTSFLWKIFAATVEWSGKKCGFVNCGLGHHSRVLSLSLSIKDKARIKKSFHVLSCFFTRYKWIYEISFSAEYFEFDFAEFFFLLRRRWGIFYDKSKFNFQTRIK